MKIPSEPPRRYVESGAPESELFEHLAPPPMTDAQAARCEARIGELARTPSPNAGVGPIAKVLVVLAATAIPAVFAARHLLQASGGPRAPETSLVTTPSQIVTSSPAPSDSATEIAAVSESSVDVGSLPSLGAHPNAPTRGNTSNPRAPANTAPPMIGAQGGPPASPSASDRLARELTLVDHARARVASDPATALRDLDQHAVEFPNGQLMAEREVVAVDALQRLGRSEEARARAQAFIDRAPGSSAARRIKSLLNGPAGALSH